MTVSKRLEQPKDKVSADKNVASYTKYHANSATKHTQEKPDANPTHEQQNTERSARKRQIKNTHKQQKKKQKAQQRSQPQQINA
uniref:Uncharacterized protein n=1 Tax=Nothobranchius korthausae TaxID=1143690 RepID=A0A1A8G796_9TELE